MDLRGEITQRLEWEERQRNSIARLTFEQCMLQLSLILVCAQESRGHCPICGARAWWCGCDEHDLRQAIWDWAQSAPDGQLLVKLKSDAEAVRTPKAVCVISPTTKSRRKMMKKFWSNHQASRPAITTVAIKSLRASPRKRVRWNPFPGSPNRSARGVIYVCLSRDYNSLPGLGKRLL